MSWQARAVRWHVHGGLAEWSPLEWAGAMCGEAGEAANFAKKLKRVTSELANNDRRNPAWEASTEELADKYRGEIAKEVADAIIYGLLLMAAVGANAEEVIRDVFNKKSEEYGFPERI